MATLTGWFLKKKSGMGKRGHRRWVELWDGEVRYFENEPGNVGHNQKGTISLTGPGVSCSAAGAVLTLTAKGKTWTFESVTEATVAEWAAAIAAQLSPLRGAAASTSRPPAASALLSAPAPAPTTAPTESARRQSTGRKLPQPPSSQARSASRSQGAAPTPDTGHERRKSWPNPNFDPDAGDDVPCSSTPPMSSNGRARRPPRPSTGSRRSPTAASSALPTRRMSAAGSDRRSPTPDSMAAVAKSEAADAREPAQAAAVASGAEPAVAAASGGEAATKPATTSEAAAEAQAAAPASAPAAAAAAADIAPARSESQDSDEPLPPNPAGGVTAAASSGHGVGGGTAPASAAAPSRPSASGAAVSPSVSAASPRSAASVSAGAAALSTAPSAAPELTVDLSGWFMKRGEGKHAGFKRRFCRLEGNTIAYYVKCDPGGTPSKAKGLISLNAHARATSEGPRLTIETAARTWVLLADKNAAGAAQAATWASTVNSVCGAAAGGAPRSRTRTIDLGKGVLSSSTVDAAAPAQLRGWFVKNSGSKLGKRHRRWFVLVDTELQYFVGPGPDGSGESQKGSVELLDESHVSVDGAMLRVKNPDREWTLTAESPAEAAQWHAALERLETGVSASDVNPNPHAWFNVRSPSGSEQSRFCVLAGDHIDIYEKSTGESHGVGLIVSVPLDASTRVEARGADLCVEGKDRVWYLHAEDDDVAEEWAAHVSAAIDAAQVQSLAPDDFEGEDGGAAGVGCGADAAVIRAKHDAAFRQRSDTLDPGPMLEHVRALVATADEGADLSYAAVKSELVDKFGSRVVRAYRQAILDELPAVGGGGGGGAKVVAYADDDAGDGSGGSGGSGGSFMSGWFVKRVPKRKDRRRYCELHDEGIRYFENIDDGSAVSQKGTIRVDRATLVSTEGTSLVITNKERVWELVARSAAEADAWRDAVQQQVLEAGFSARGSGAVDMTPGRGVWLVKHKAKTLAHARRRYFTPEYNRSGDTLTFAYFASVTAAGRPTDQKGAILIAEGTTVSCDGCNLRIANGAEKWLLTAENSSVAARWRALLTALQRERSELGAKKGAADGGGGGVPLLVRLQELLASSDVLPYDAAEDALIKEHGQTMFELFEDEVAAAVRRKEEMSAAAAGEGGVWLRKKPDGKGRSQLRWFELHDRSFCYFARIANGRGADQKGSCTITQASDIRCEANVITVQNPDRRWELTASSDEVARAWSGRLLELQQRDFRNFDAALDDLVGAQKLPFADVRQRLVAEFGAEAFEFRRQTVVGRLPDASAGGASGAAAAGAATCGLWMSKKGAGKTAKSHRRWFELHGTELQYFESRRDDGRGVTQKGSVEILPQTKLEVSGRRLVVANPDRTWDLTADTEDAAVTLLGHLEKARGDEVRQLASAIDGAIDAAAVDGKTFAEVKQEVIAAHGEDAFESRKGSIARRVGAAAAAGGAAADAGADKGSGAATGAASSSPPPPEQPVRCGWLLKRPPGVGKKQRRWFVLVDDELQYYVSEKLGKGVDQRGAIQVNPSTSVSTNGRTLQIANPDGRRTWVLDAASAREASEWEGWLLEAQAHARAAFYARVEAIKAERRGELHFAELELALRAEFGDEMLDHERAALGKSATFAPSPVSDAIVAEDGDEALHHAAWFTKKSGTRLGRDKKRFFVLKGTELLYFEDAVAGRGVNQRGSIEILPTTTITADGHVIRIDTGDRVWQLLADDPPQARNWQKLLLAAQASTEEPFVEALNGVVDASVADGQAPDFSEVKDALVASFGLQIFERHRRFVVEAVRHAATRATADGAPLEGVTDAASHAKMSGWMVKKGQKRFFCLIGSDVQYFRGAKGGVGDGFRGAIEISASTEVSTTGRLLSIRNTDRVWLLTAPSEEEASKWEYVLSELQPLLRTKVLGRVAELLKGVTLETFSFGPVKSAVVDEFGESTYRQNQAGIARAVIAAGLADRKATRSGWFVKKPAGSYGKDKKRFFQLGGNLVRYYVDCDAAAKDDAKGEIRLTPGTDVAADGREVHVQTASREWVFWPADGSKTATAEWEGALLVAREQLAVDMEAFFKRFAAGVKASSVRRGGAASLFALLKDSCVEEFGREEFFGFEPRILELAREVELALDGDGDRADDDDVDHAGWLLKEPRSRGKARRRYFELEGTELRYYEDFYRGRGVVEKGMVELRPEFKVEADGLHFVLRGPEREWHLTADTTADATKWAAELGEAIEAAAEEAKGIHAGEDEIDLFPGKGAWFKKRKAGGASNRLKARNRYFTLVMGIPSKNLRFNYYATVGDDGAPREKRGYIAVGQRSSVTCEGKLLQIANDDVTWRLTADEADVAARWRRLITRSLAERAAAGSGVPLAARLEELIRAGSADGGDPPELSAVNETLKAEYGAELWAEAKDIIEARVLQAQIERRRPDVPGAYFTKKAGVGKDRRRWFELHSDEIRYYVSEKEGRGVDYKGSIQIAHYTNVVFSGKELVLSNPDRTWELTGETLEEVAAWGVGLKKLVRLLSPTFSATAFDSAVVAGGPAPEDADGLADWFSLQDEGSSSTHKRFVVLQNLEIAVYRQADGMGAGSGLLETIIIGRKTAVSVGNVTVKIQTETAKWDLHAEPRRNATPPLSASQVAQEWADHLRHKRNALLKAEREKRRAAEAKRLEAAGKAADAEPEVKPIRPRHDAAEAKRRAAEEAAAREKERLDRRVVSAAEVAAARDHLASEKGGKADKRRRKRDGKKSVGCVGCVVA